MKNFGKKIVIALLMWQARVIVKRYRPRIIVVTGSVGKTSTKDALFAALKDSLYVRKSEKSFNSEIGVPLTILGLPNGWGNPIAWLSILVQGFISVCTKENYPELLILEIDTRKPGDLKQFTWLRPDIVLLTRLGHIPAHIEFFETIEGMLDEKRILVESMKEDGVVIVNADDEHLLSFARTLPRRVLTVGTRSDCVIRITHESISYSRDSIPVPLGITCRIDYGTRTQPLFINGVLGKNHTYAAVFAFATAHELNVNLVHAAEGLSQFEAPAGRLKLIEGIHNTLIIDDTYNSSPVAAESALEALSNIKTPGRKIAVLGDMLELGRHTEEAHKQLGILAGQHAHVLICVGVRSLFILEGARGAGKILKRNTYHIDDAQSAGVFLEEFLEEHDIVLIKGSQGMRLEKTVAALMRHKSERKVKLVRQEKEWITR